MKIEEMVAKSTNAGGRIKDKPLKSVVSGSSETDFVADGTIARIVPASETGYYDTNVSDRAVYTILEACTMKDGKVTPTGEAVQVYLAMFDRVAVAYVVDNEGEVVRDENKKIVRASGSVVDDWKRAANAFDFMHNNQGKTMKFELLDTVSVRAWDRAEQAFSKTKTREQKVYKINWV